MKFLLALVMFFSSFSISLAEEKAPQLCWTHGQCQTQAPVLESKCMLVKLPSRNPDGSAACVIRCPTMLMGSYCEFIEGRVFGICRREGWYQIPDPTDCSGAIDAGDLP